jgi:hypothetical protein
MIMLRERPYVLHELVIDRAIGTYTSRQQGNLCIEAVVQSALHKAIQRVAHRHAGKRQRCTGKRKRGEQQATAYGAGNEPQGRWTSLSNEPTVLIIMPAKPKLNGTIQAGVKPQRYYEPVSTADCFA